MKNTKTVFVHAWEYVNMCDGTPDAGGGGFNWYPKEADARKAFAEGALQPGVDPADTGDFFFTVEVPNTLTRDHTTYRIDVNLHDLCAKAKERRIGANVLRYWKTNKFKMGGAKRASRAA